MVNENIKKILNRVVAIPTLPSMVREVLSLLQQKNTTANDLQQVITKDPAIAVKVLKLVNSSYYGFPSKIASIQHALTILGFNTLRSLVLSISAFDSLSKGLDRSSFDFTQYSIHCNACAITAKIIAKPIANIDEEDAFAIGLLHDIGKVIMCKYMNKEFAEVSQKVKETQRPAFEVEQEILGFTHGDIGGWLAEHWKLPETIINGISRHHHIDAQEKNLLPAIVHLADILCIAKGLGTDHNMIVPPLDQNAWNNLKMTKKKIVGTMNEIDDQIAKAIELFETMK